MVTLPWKDLDLRQGAGRRIPSLMQHFFRALMRSRRDDTIPTTNFLELLARTPNAVRLPANTSELMEHALSIGWAEEPARKH